jgi:hypothetical protein
MPEIICIYCVHWNIHWPSYCNVHVYIVINFCDSMCSLVWKPICGGFYRLFLCIVVGDPVIKMEGLGSHQRVLHRHIFVSDPRQDLDFPTSYVVVFFFLMFKELRWEVIVRFVDIGEIVDHHCLNSIFSIWKYLHSNFKKRNKK